MSISQCLHRPFPIRTFLRFSSIICWFPMRFLVYYTVYPCVCPVNAARVLPSVPQCFPCVMTCISGETSLSISHEFPCLASVSCCYVSRQLFLGSQVRFQGVTRCVPCVFPHAFILSFIIHQKFSFARDWSKRVT